MKNPRIEEPGAHLYPTLRMTRYSQDTSLPICQFNSVPFTMEAYGTVSELIEMMIRSTVTV